ncbi:hypothetical protein ACVC7O_22135 (plasmid) [Roseobacter sp. A03A-229]
MTEAEFLTLARMAADEADRSGFTNTARALRQVIREMSTTSACYHVETSDSSGAHRYSSLHS